MLLGKEPTTSPKSRRSIEILLAAMYSTLLILLFFSRASETLHKHIAKLWEMRSISCAFASLQQTSLFSPYLSTKFSLATRKKIDFGCQHVIPATFTKRTVTTTLNVTNKCPLYLRIYYYYEPLMTALHENRDESTNCSCAWLGPRGRRCGGRHSSLPQQLGCAT